jgi:Trypsin
MKRRSLAAGLVLAALLLLPASASGVWGGQLDTTHSNVGAMYFDYPREDGSGPLVDGLICSGSYAGPSKTGANDVFLLAGHCLPSPEDGISASDLYVSYSNNAGVTDTHVPVSSPIQVASYHQMPGFGHDLGDLHDLGILLLPRGSAGSLTPVQLAPAGYLDTLKQQGTLNFRSVTLVGYGVTPDWETPGPTGFAFDGQRKTGSSVITGLGKAFVRLSQNNGIGTGSGLCFGDSGSPQFDAATNRVISVTSGGNGQCNANNYDYRVDTPQARAFLGEFLNLP